MKPSEYFPDKVETYLSCLSDRTLNAGTDVVSDIIVYDTAAPYTVKDYQNALEAWPHTKRIRQTKTLPS